MSTFELNYEEARKRIKTGDLIAFSARPFSLFNHLIRFGQWWESGDNFGGTHNIIHVGIAIRTIHNEVMLAEFTFGGFFKVGFKFTQLSQRVKNYEGTVLHFPLTKKARTHLDKNAAIEWVEEVRQGKYRYNFLGMPMAVTKIIGKLFAISRRPGAAFCSEGVQRCWIRIGVKPHEELVIVDDPWSASVTLVRAAVIPTMFTPAECCRDRVVNFDDALILR